MRYILLAIAVTLLLSSWENPFLSIEEVSQSASGESASGGPGLPPEMPPRAVDPIRPILLGLIIILVVAKIGGEVAHRLGQPPVLGELLLGILLGNVYFLTGLEHFNFLQHNVFLDYMGRFGAIILLCRVGLETDLAAMMEAGLSAISVAFGGVIAPCVLGYVLCLYLFPEIEPQARLMVITALCATSVGITVRVFEDLGRIQAPEARIVLGAAIADDVLGLLILSVVTATIVSGSLAFGGVVQTAAYAMVFLFGAGVISLKFSQTLGHYISRFQTEGMKLFSAVLICFFLSYLADYIGLAPIVGAFAAGLILKDIKVIDLQGHEHAMDEMIRPAYLVFVPIFFVLMGFQVRLESFLDRSAVLLAMGLTLAAVLGKLFSGLCVMQRGINRLCVGIAMIPRGEVGLIFASMGKVLGVLSDSLYSAIVIMVMFTTLITPPLLKGIIYTPQEFEAYRAKTGRYET